jgi:TIR domain/WD domain, G-beta repeat
MAGASRDADLDARSGRRWDVALSFAGAQRGYVGQVAEALKAREVRCFYDADEQVRLWGTHLAEELPRIYARESAAVVVFISADYAGRDWTRLERRAAFSRAVAEAGVYVLPARFDDSELPGLLLDVVAVDLRRYTPGQFADLVAAKLADLAISPSPHGVEGPCTEQATQTRAVSVQTGQGQAARLIDSAERTAQLAPEDAADQPHPRREAAEAEAARCRILTGHKGDVYGVAFSPDGRLLASCGNNMRVRLWDPATGEHRRTLTGHTGWVLPQVSCVAFSPDGQLLASGGSDKTVRLWDPATGEHRRTLTGHTGWGYPGASCVAFSPDDQLLASGGSDKTVRLWDLARLDVEHTGAT